MMRDLQASKRARLALLVLLGLLATAAPSANADTILRFEIDPDASSITYDCLSACDSGPFAISGRFELHLLDPYVVDLGYGNARLSDESVATGNLPEPFHFPSYYAELDGAQLRGDADGCSWPGPPGVSGLCLSSGFFDTFSGTFDGSLLRMTGVDYLGAHRSPNYAFEIVASVVPEPSSAILGAAAIWLAAMLQGTRRSGGGAFRLY